MKKERLYLIAAIITGVLAITAIIYCYPYQAQGSISQSTITRFNPMICETGLTSDFTNGYYEIGSNKKVDFDLDTPVWSVFEISGNCVYDIEQHKSIPYDELSPEVKYNLCK
jgi:hypothetical protein